MKGNYKNFLNEKITLLIRIHLLLSILLAANSSFLIAETTLFEINVSRSIDKEVVEPGGKIKVQLAVYVMGNVTGLIVTEKLPSGFEILESRPTPSKYDKVKGEVKWLFYDNKGVKSTVLNYTIYVPLGTIEMIHRIEGNWSAIGFSGTKLGMILPTQVRVQKNPSTISCSIPSANASFGETVTISGAISPAHKNVTVVLTYKKPDGFEFDRTVITLPDGSYSDAYKVDMAGSWNVTARWLGDEDHRGSISPAVVFYVEEEKNFIILMMVLVVVTIGLVALMVAIKLVRHS